MCVLVTAQNNFQYKKRKHGVITTHSSCDFTSRIVAQLGLYAIILFQLSEFVSQRRLRLQMSQLSKFTCVVSRHTEQ